MVSVSWGDSTFGTVTPVAFVAADTEVQVVGSPAEPPALALAPRASAAIVPPVRATVVTRVRTCSMLRPPSSVRRRSGDSRQPIDGWYRAGSAGIAGP